MKKQITVTPKILELSNSNDIYMTMNIRILSAEPNLNLAEFSEDFILNTVKNKEEFIGIPFMVDRESLENGDYSNLTHQLTAEGELLTDQIGSFVDFWADKDEDGVMFLGGSIRIMKRFEKTCESIYELYSEGELNTSCEVMVSDYEEISEDGVRKIHYNKGKNRLFASCVVTSPADVKARPTLLVAEAYEQDIKAEQKGGEELAKNTKDKIETFNKGIDIKYHGSFELSGLKIHELEQKIFNLVNPVDTENGGRDYNFWIRELYTDAVIFEDDDNWKVLYKAKYTVEGDTVTLADQDDWIQGSYGFIPDGVEINELMEQNSQKIEELETELSELREEKNTMSKEKETTIEELNAKIKKLDTEIATLKERNETLEETIVSQKEELVKADEKETELNGKIEELEPFKAQVEKAAKDAEIADLTNKFSKLMDEETFKSEEVAEAIENLDETKLNSIVVAEVAKKAIETAEEGTDSKDDIEIAASQTGDLVPQTKDASYWASSN